MDLSEQIPGELPWTGERLLTVVQGATAIEHLHRYSMACALAHGVDVLDIASGEGYGSNLLAAQARHVTGVDVCPDAVRHANNKYSSANLTFKVGDCAAIPLADASVDLVVSFETLEHHDKHQEMMAEVKRVLRPDGVLVLSTPNKRLYTDLPGTTNPFHVKELYREEFEELLRGHFRSHVLLGQLMCDGSVIAPLGEQTGAALEVLEGDFQGTDRTAWLEQALYFVAIATNGPRLPVAPLGVFDGKRLWPTRPQYLAECAAYIRGLEARLRDREAELAQRTQELASIRSSRSWKLVRAVSRMAGVAGRLKRRLAARQKQSA